MCDDCEGTGKKVKAGDQCKGISFVYLTVCLFYYSTGKNTG
jgi:hypothetical protein